MAQDRQHLSERQLDRIYKGQIRPDLLDGVETSKVPTAVIVGGQPGAGKSYALARVRSNLVASVGVSAVVSGDEVREYHPYWRAHGMQDPMAATATQPDVRQWYARLAGDAIARRVNVVLESALRAPEGAATLCRQLRDAGYQVAVVALATDRDQSRQTIIARYEVARSVGISPVFVVAQSHDTAYERLRESIAKMETEHWVDRIQVIARDGRQLYANHIDGEHWVREPKATYVLDDFRERSLPARDLADNALRWQELLGRLRLDLSVPAQVTEQAAQWCNESVARAQGDSEAARLLAWGEEARAFRALNRVEFLRRFPQHGDSVDRLKDAVTFAEHNFADSADRHRFIEQARHRLAERIAEGRADATARRIEKSNARGPKVR